MTFITLKSPSPGTVTVSFTFASKPALRPSKVISILCSSSFMSIPATVKPKTDPSPIVSMLISATRPEISAFRQSFTFSAGRDVLSDRMPLTLAVSGSSSVIRAPSSVTAASSGAVENAKSNFFISGSSMSKSLPRARVPLYSFPGFNSPSSGMNSRVDDEIHLVYPFNVGENESSLSSPLF